MSNTLTAPKFGTRQIVIVGMLSAISVILGFTGYGFIPLPAAKATIMHLPVIIGAIIEGPVVGIMVGLIFGLFSIFQNITNPSLLSFAFVNPLVSVLPRMLIGVTAYYSYRLMGNIKLFSLGRSEGFKVGVGAAIGSLTNTFGVLSMIYFIYAAQYAQANEIDPSMAAKVIYGIAFTNGLPEAAIAVVVTVPVVLAVKRIMKR